MENKKNSRALQITKTQMEKCEGLQIAVCSNSATTKKLTTNLVQNQSLEEEEEDKEETSAPNCKTQLGRRRRSWSSRPAAAAHWRSANPQARISVFVILWYLPPSLTPFLSFFLPSCVLLGPGYYYFAT